MKRRAIGLGLACATAVGVSTASAPVRIAAAAPACEIERVERIVAVGDVHGAYDRFVGILQTAGILDRRLRWAGGRAHLVQLGDVVDRGPDSRKALDLVERLQDEARRSGGAVHALLGNYEVMRMLGDVRYVTPGEYEAFVTSRSEQVKSDFLSTVNPQLRDQLPKDMPLGYLEMLVAFGPKGHYGEWLRKLDAVVKINGVLFVHGGISPEIAGMSCDVLDTAVRREITTDVDATGSTPPDFSLSSGENGPLWYRGLAQEPDAFAKSTDEILAKQNARAIVIAHTVTSGRRIEMRFGGKVFLIDTGMQPGYIENGRASALDIKGGVFTAIYTDRRDVLFKLPADAPKAAAPFAPPVDLRSATR